MACCRVAGLSFQLPPMGRGPAVTDGLRRGTKRFRPPFAEGQSFVLSSFLTPSQEPLHGRTFLKNSFAPTSAQGADSALEAEGPIFMNSISKATM